MTPKPRFWLCRIYLCLSVLATAGIGLADPTGKHYESMSGDGMGGAAAFSVLVIAAVVGLLDTIGYDLLRLRRCIPNFLRRFRFLWLMVLAVGVLSLAVPQTKWSGVEPVVFRYLLDCFFALACTIGDLTTRARGK